MELSMYELELFAGMRGINVQKTLKIDELFENISKYGKKSYDESPFKSIILDIRSILPKKGEKKVKKVLEYSEEMKELTSLQIENGKNNLIKLKTDLIKKFKKSIRTTKADREYYDYKDNKFYGLKDVRTLFNKNDDDTDVYEDTEYLFNENDKLKEYADDIKEIIKNKEVKYEYEHIEDINYVKNKQYLINSEEKKDWL